MKKIVGALLMVVALSACVSTSADRVPHPVTATGETTLAPRALKDCIIQNQPKHYAVAEQNGGYRLTMKMRGDTMFVVDITPAPTLSAIGSRVEVFAPVRIVKKRFARCGVILR